MILARAHWSLYFLFWVALIVAAGAVLGAALFPLGGWLLGLAQPAGRLAMQGASTGGFFFAIWAPGTAVVLCVMRAYRRRHPEAR
jgi:hypothetical protein